MYALMRLPFEVDAPEWVSLFVIFANRWLWIVALLAWSYRWMNRPFGWLPYATEAVYPWYILHQTITVWIGYHVSRHALGPVGEPLVVIGVTVVGCLVLHEFVIRRTAWLRPLFGLAPEKGHVGIKPVALHNGA
jgi:glucans biosynthesis protein C